MQGDLSELEELWSRVLDNWLDDSAHGAFIEYCRRTGQLAKAASRYRVESESEGGPYRDGSRREIAKKRLSAIVLLAMAELKATQSDPQTEKARVIKSLIRWVLIAVLIVFGLSSVRFVGLLPRLWSG